MSKKTATSGNWVPTVDALLVVSWVYVRCELMGAWDGEGVGSGWGKARPRQGAG